MKWEPAYIERLVRNVRKIIAEEADGRPARVHVPDVHVSLGRGFVLTRQEVEEGDLVRVANIALQIGAVIPSSNFVVHVNGRDCIPTQEELDALDRIEIEVSVPGASAVS